MLINLLFFSPQQTLLSARNIRFITTENEVSVIGFLGTLWYNIWSTKDALVDLLIVNSHLIGSVLFFHYQIKPENCFFFLCVVVVKYLILPHASITSGRTRSHSK